MNGIVIARGGEPSAAHALRPAAARRESASASAGCTSTRRRSPPSSSSARSGSRSTRCARSGSGTASRSRSSSRRPTVGVVVVEVAARIPGGQMADLVRHAVGVDLVEIALRQALGEDVPDELALPRFSQPLAIRFFTAEPGPLPTGRVLAIGSLDPVLAAEGVVQADTYLEVGETIRPVRRDGDRRGYVIAVGDTPDDGRPARGRRREAPDRRGRRMSDPRTRVVERGYDAISDSFVEWRDRIVDDPRRAWREALTSRLERRSARPRARLRGRSPGYAAPRRAVSRDRRRHLRGADRARSRRTSRARTSSRPTSPRSSWSPGSSTPSPRSTPSTTSRAISSADALRADPHMARTGRALPRRRSARATPRRGPATGSGRRCSSRAFRRRRPADCCRRPDSSSLLDELVPMLEPEGEVAFHWVLARR